MTKKRILIVEDDPSVLKMTSIRLRHEGYDVLTATDGESALSTIDQDPQIHLILLDVRLPKIDGYEVCRTVKRQPATMHIPVIIFSASESQLGRLADRCIEAGAVDCIRKPFQTRDLLGKIHRVLEEEGEVHGG